MAKTPDNVLDNRIETLNMHSKRHYEYRHLNGSWGIYMAEGGPIQTIATGLRSRRDLLNAIDGLINYTLLEAIAPSKEA